MDDPYTVLGVAPTATDAEIRAAYRKLAKRHHPDLNPGKPEAEAHFKSISAAHALLSDPEKRARFDRGEIDATGAERPAERSFYRDFGDDAGRAKYRPEHIFDPEDFESVFAQAFRARTQGGRDAYFALSIDLADAVHGTVRRVAMPDGRTLDIKVPAGVRDGQVLRLKGQGMPGYGDGSPGDALIEITLVPHPLFRRDGDDVTLELPVTLKEAVLGAKVEVPTLKGPVTLTIPPNSSSGTKLRLKGRGLAEGHQYVLLTIVLPAHAEPELAAFLESWVPREPFDPRERVRL